jgi:hypothetical protein
VKERGGKRQQAINKRHNDCDRTAGGREEEEAIQSKRATANCSEATARITAQEESGEEEAIQGKPSTAAQDAITA